VVAKIGAGLPNKMRGRGISIKTDTAIPIADPIFGAIEAHRKAALGRHEASEDSHVAPGGARKAYTGAAFYDAGAREDDEALQVLFFTVPATRESLIALFQYAQEPLPSGGTYGGKTVIGDFIEMCADGGEEWSPTQFTRNMELALRRIAAE
jgi:hypothetical protein